MTPSPQSVPSTPTPNESRWTRRQWIGAACAGLVTAGCDKLPKFSLNRALQVRGEIHVLIWDNYLSPDILAGFQKATGIRPVLHLFSSNDQLADLLRTRAEPYDLVMPSSFKAAQLRDLGLIKSFNRANIPRLSEIDGLKFNSKFDPKNQYLVPYIWGATGIGYNAGRVNGLPKSWADLFSYQLRPDGTNAGVSVLDDARFALGTVLLYLKKSPNSASAEDVEKAGEILLRLRDRITFFESNDVAKLLAHNTVDLAMAWSGDVTRAMLGDPGNGITPNKKVRLSLPLEGAILFRDGFCVPRAAEHQAEAEQFVNYLLNPMVAAAVTNHSLYATTVPAARSHVDRFILNGPSFFVHPEGAQNNHTLDDVTGIEDVYRRVWQQVKTGPRPPLDGIQVPGLPGAAPEPTPPVKT
jgi:putrescine transport system substrate-binding protein